VRLALRLARSFFHNQIFRKQEEKVSNKYWQASASKVQDLTEMVQTDVLTQLMKTDPAIAERLCKVNWQQVADHTITEAIKVLAKRCGWTFVSAQDGLRSKKGLPDGIFLGALATADRGQTLVWIRTARGVKCVEQIFEHYNALNARTIVQLREDFATCHREQAHLTLAQVLSGGHVQQRQQGDQIVLMFEMEV
jgi:hypothetical protein